MSSFVARNPIRRLTHPSEIPLSIQFNQGNYSSGNGNVPLLTLSAELIEQIFKEVVFDETGAPTLPRLNHLLSLKTICKAISACKDAFNATVFDARVVRRSSIVPRNNPSTQRFIIDINGGVQLPLKYYFDGRVSHISLLAFRDCDDTSRENHWAKHATKINLCLVTPLPGDPRKLLAIELDVEQAMRMFNGRCREHSLVFQEHTSATLKLLPDIFYNEAADEAFSKTTIVKSDRVTTDVVFGKRLNEGVVRFITSPGGEPLLENQNLTCSFEQISRLFGRFDEDAIGNCKYVDRFGLPASVVACEAVRVARDEAMATARRVEAIRADRAAHAHMANGGEKTLMRPWEDGYAERRAEAEAAGLRDASLRYSDDDDTSSEDESDHEEYSPPAKKARKAPVRRRAAPARRRAAPAAGSSSESAIDLCSDSDCD